MESGEKFLRGYVWPVLKAHSVFVNSHCFDGGSVFHSDARAHANPWQRPTYSVQVIRREGEVGQRAASSNSVLPLTVDVIDHHAGETTRYTVTNGDLIALLTTGDMGRFIECAEAL